MYMQPSGNVLVGCECSGVVREAFRRRGYNAYSCDLKPAEDGSRWHLQMDVRRAVRERRQWALAIFHPNCQYLCSSGLHWNKKDPARRALTEEALVFVAELLSADIPLIALENPIGCISSRIRKPDQIIQPYQFGHDASKATCLWLKGLDKLQPTIYVAPRIVDGKSRWANQTDSGQNRLGPSDHRAADRARTYTGIAEAMADRWGSRLTKERYAA
jgi:hypothetical protein